MRKVVVKWSLAVAMLAVGAAAQAHSDKPQERGVGNLEVVQAGQQLSMVLESPVVNLLGFQHAAQTDADRVKVRRVVNLLRANGLFHINREADCKRVDHRLISEVLNPTQAGSDHTHDLESMRAVWEFECAKPEAIKTIDVRLLRQFTGFEKINASVLMGQMQQNLELSPRSAIIQTQ